MFSQSFSVVDGSEMAATADRFLIGEDVGWGLVNAALHIA